MFKKKRFAGLIIELTNVCNLSCPLCPTGTGIHNRPKGRISFENFRRIIDKNSPFIETVSLWGIGEPFLIKDLPRMIRYANQKGLRVWVSTNLTILTDSLLEKLVGQRFNLIFSIDGLSEKTYKKYRVGSDFETVLKNLSRLVRAKKNKGARNPHLIWQFIVMRHNEKEINRLVPFAQRHGADEVWIKSVVPAKPGDRSYAKFKPRKKIYQNKPLLNPDGSLRCYMIEQYPIVFWNGDVVPCAFDSQGNFQMGNLLRQRIDVIWRGKKFSDFREKSRQGKISMCNYCGGRDPKSENVKKIKIKGEKTLSRSWI